jgi:hypothetical protein
MRSRAMPLTTVMAVMLVWIAGGCGDRNEARVAPSPAAQATTPASPATPASSPSLVATRAPSPAPTRNASAEDPLDLGTASVLAIDLGWVYADGDAADLHRCVRMTVARVDCEIYFKSEFRDYPPITFAIARRGKRFVGAWYHYPDVPKDDKLVALGRLYAKAGAKWDPTDYLRDDVGYGRPKLKGLLRKQCALQSCG